jgi:hypothetical protein
LSAPEKVPIVILAGSDLQPGPVPAGAEGLHFLVGYKGADIRIGGIPLIQLLLERIRASRAFGEIYLAGPARIYRELVDCPIIDTDGHLGRNVRAAVKHLLEQYGPDAGIAFISNDVLPEPEEISALAADLVPAGGSESVALAFSLITCGQDLGAAEWKPKYRLRVGPAGEPALFLPGHLGVAWPARMRLGLLYRLLRLAYRERNREYRRRQRRILLRLIHYLVGKDLASLLRLRPPTLTWTVLRHGLGTFIRWRRGDLDIEGLARGIAAVAVRRGTFHRYGARCVRIAITSHASFGKDIDTREELEELEQALMTKRP